MTPNCEQCAHFKVGFSPTNKNLCDRTGKSALWERASKLSTFKTMPESAFHRFEIQPVRDNCGLEGQFFEARQ